MLAVVIPYYQGENYINACLETINSSSITPERIYIVDNDPTGLQTTLRESNCIVIKTASAIGFGRACNIGVYQAIQDGATQIILTNQDVVFKPDAIEHLCSTLEVLEQNDICLPMSMNYELSSIEPHFANRTLIATSYFKDVSSNINHATYDVTLAGAACIAFKSHTIQHIGLFDPVFYMYGEDDDFFNRVMHNGGTLKLSTQAFIGHFHSNVNDEENRKTISEWSRTSTDILLIRSGVPFSKYLYKAVRSTLGTTLREGILASLKKIQLHSRHLSNWSKIRSTDVETIKRRIKTQINTDLRNE